ncbi:hypothetical protein ABBQ38_014461 [Trebouxia sp. C0009 RCD-2024]
MEVSTPARARCTISRTISATSGLWQSSTVADGCLRLRGAQHSFLYMPEPVTSPALGDHTAGVPYSALG